MPKVMIIGRGVRQISGGNEYPYDVGVILDQPDQPIALCEGSGHWGSGGSFTLQELRKDRWREHLALCGCEWLVALAEEEERRGRRFSPEEIIERWKCV